MLSPLGDTRSTVTTANEQGSAAAGDAHGGQKDGAASWLPRSSGKSNVRRRTVRPRLFWGTDVTSAFRGISAAVLRRNGWQGYFRTNWRPHFNVRGDVRAIQHFARLQRRKPGDRFVRHADAMQHAPALDLTTRLLIVDDDPGIRDLTARFLIGHGYVVDTADGAVEMRAALARTDYALVVLDVMMPGEDGLTILRSLDRATSPPVILHSAVGEDVDRIVGLEMGADDYVAKPANPRELLARIRSVLRRSGTVPAAPLPAQARRWLRFAGWRLDPVGRELLDPDGVVINLSDGEFRLLLALVEHPRRVLSRDQLLDLSRGVNAEQFDRAIDVQMSRLRKKLARDDAFDLIRTVRSEGYLFAAEVTGG